MTNSIRQTFAERQHKDCDCACDICHPSSGKHCGLPPCDVPTDPTDLNDVFTALIGMSPEEWDLFSKELEKQIPLVAVAYVIEPTIKAFSTPPDAECSPVVECYLE